MKLENLFQLAIDKRASDILLSPGAPPTLRVEGQLQSASGTRLTNEHMQSILQILLPTTSYQEVIRGEEFDGAVEVLGARFRVAAYLRDGGPALALRRIPREVPPPEQLGLPVVLNDLVQRPQGLILFAGASGQGKSTSQASLLEFLNRTTHKHIVTIEDPIEYLHTSDKCIIDQREVGRDTESFQKALTHVMRENPDVVLIGEMRDPAAISAAITLAEMGHLVLSTVHANDAVQTIYRIINAFPSHEHKQLRMQLSLALCAVVCQRLVLSKDGKLVLALELLVNTPAVAAQIREDRVEQLYSSMELDHKSGMVTMNQSLRRLVDGNVIERSLADRFMNIYESQKS